MKIFLAITVVIVLSLLAFVSYFYWQKSEKPDAVSVPSFGNDQVEKAIENYLLTQKGFSWETHEGSHNFCAVENLSSEAGLFPFYVWAYCGEYKIENGKLKMLSGSSGPVKISYPNELSFYRVDKFTHEAPGDGAQYTKDVKQIFPEDIQEKIFHFNQTNIIKRAESVAFTNISSWESIKEAIRNCEVVQTFQAHNRDVSAQLKNGGKITAVEPELDDIIKAAESAEPKCGRIMMATE